MATIDVKDAANVTRTIEAPLTPGRALAVNSRPVALSTEDKTALDALATSAQQTSQSTLFGAVTETAPGTDTASSGLNGRLQRIAQNLTTLIAKFTLGAGTATAALRTTLASDDPLVAGMTRGVLAPTTTITRPADTSAYTAGDAFANSTSAPTAGGFVLTSVVAATGKSAILTDIIIESSNVPTTPLQGEIWLFNASVTAINDNAAFTAPSITPIAIIPFALSNVGTKSYANVEIGGRGILTSGSANLNFLVRVANAYVPASAEALKVIAKFQGVN